MISKKKHSGGGLFWRSRSKSMSSMGTNTKNMKRRYSRKDGRRKMKEVIARTYQKILEHRVKEQESKDKTIQKLSDDIIKLEDTLKEYIVPTINKVKKKTSLYQKYKNQNKWNKLVTREEQLKVAELAKKQQESEGNSYMDSSKTVDMLSNKITYQIVGNRTQQSSRMSSFF